MQHAAYPVVGVNRNRALLHNHFVALDGARNLRHYSLNIGEVRRAAIALRGAHGDKYRLALFNCLCQVRGEHHSAAAVLGQQLRQVLLKNGHAALAELLHPGFIIIDADHLVAHVGKTGCRNQPNIS